MRGASSRESSTWGLGLYLLLAIGNEGGGVLIIWRGDLWGGRVSCLFPLDLVRDFVSVLGLPGVVWLLMALLANVAGQVAQVMIPESWLGSSPTWRVGGGAGPCSLGRLLFCPSAGSCVLMCGHTLSLSNE